MNTESIISLISNIRNSANVMITEELGKVGVTDIVTSHGNILISLYRHGPLTMNRLATLIGRKKNTVTVLINKLKTAGYVKLSKPINDNRVTIVELTHKGEEFQLQFQEISEHLLKEVWKGIPVTERKAIVQGLTKIALNLHRP